MADRTPPGRLILFLLVIVPFVPLLVYIVQVVAVTLGGVAAQAWSGVNWSALPPEASQPASQMHDVYHFLLLLFTSSLGVAVLIAASLVKDALSG